MCLYTGCGKTTFASSLVIRLQLMNHKLLGAVFLPFKHGNCSYPRSIIRSLACQIAERIPELQKTILLVAEDCGDVKDHLDLYVMFKRFLLHPLQLYEEKMKAQQKPLNNKVIIIDGLEDCGIEPYGVDFHQEILDLLCILMMELPFWVKLVFTSRPDWKFDRRMLQYKHLIREPSDQQSREREDIAAFVNCQLLLDSVSHDQAVVVNTGNDLDKMSLSNVLIKAVGFEYFRMVSLLSHRQSNPIIVNPSSSSSLPNSLYECYFTFFEGIRVTYVKHYDPRLQIDNSVFMKHFMGALHVLLCSHEPISKHLLALMLNLTDCDVEVLCEQLYPIYPLSNGIFLLDSCCRCMNEWLLMKKSDCIFNVNRSDGNNLIKHYFMFEIHKYLEGVPAFDYSH